MSKIMKIIFFMTLCFKFSYDKYIVFKFKTNVDLNKLNEENYMNTTMDQKLYVDFVIGDSHQNIPMTLKTEQYPTFIVSSRVIDDTRVKYNENISSTSFKYISQWQSKNLYKLDFSEGYYVNDSISFNSSFSYTNFTYMLATETKVTAKNISGEIGLSRSFDNEYPYGDSIKTCFLEQLYNNKLIDEKIFGIVYDNDFEGRLIFGTYLHLFDDFYSEKEMISDYTLERFNDEGNFGRWGISLNIKGLKQPDNEEIYIENNTYGIFIYEIGLICGSHTFRQNFAINYFKNKNCTESLISSKPYSFFQYSCDNEEQFSDFPDLNFLYPGKYSFIFNKDELFKKIGKKYIFQIVFEINENNFTFWRLGQIFFKKYNIFLNKKEKQSTFSYYLRKKNIENDESKISGQILTIIILSIILTFLIGAIIIFFIFFYEKKRKKRVQELDEGDEYDYTPKINAQEVKDTLLTN